MGCPRGGLLEVNHGGRTALERHGGTRGMGVVATACMSGSRASSGLWVEETTPACCCHLHKLPALPCSSAQICRGAAHPQPCHPCAPHAASPINSRMGSGAQSCRRWPPVPRALMCEIPERGCQFLAYSHPCNLIKNGVIFLNPLRPLLPHFNVPTFEHPY